jgi:hypothetical protein
MLARSRWPDLAGLVGKHDLEVGEIDLLSVPKIRFWNNGDEVR